MKLESIKKCAKKNYFSSVILKYKNNIKKTWNVIKEATGKLDVITKTFIQKKVLLRKETITSSKLIAENVNNFFTEIGPKLASEIEKTAKTFDVYLKKVFFL